jgi:protein O-mannosyl-transferase
MRKRGCTVDKAQSGFVEKSEMKNSAPPGFLKKYSRWVFFGWLIAATLLAYLPALRGGFIWDDDHWTTGLSRLLQDCSGLVTMWRHPTALQQYYPLSGTSFWLDYRFWGFWTTPYHIENVLLHLTAVFLFWRLLVRLRIPGAWLAAGLFALHPLMVESVAWITERKNVLSLALYLAALLAYPGFVQQVTDYQSPVSRMNSAGSRATGRVWLWYGLALGLFLGAMLAKATAFSLPAVILLLIYWQRGFFRWRTDILPTLPFFVLGVGLCLVTAWLETNHVGAKGPDFALSFPQRCLVAGRVFWFYPAQLLWPANLCFVYPRWQPDPAVWWQWLYPAGAAGTLLGLWWARGRIGRGPVTAAFFYVGTLFPVLGFMNAYFMRYSFVCDHWVYLSSLGLLALVAALVTRAAERLQRQILVYGFAVIVLPVLGLLTWRQAGVYQDMETLWRTTLAQNPDSWMAQNNLGATLVRQGKVTEGIQCYDRALRLKSDSAEVHCNLGNALVTRGELVAAMQHYDRALQLDPDYYAARLNLGVAMARQGKAGEAIQHLRRALQINPDDAETCFYLGVALTAQGKLDDALQCYQQALQINPHHADALNNIGGALTVQGKYRDAIAFFERALELKPDSAETHHNLGEALAKCDRWEDAIQHQQRALEIKPDYIDALNSLGIVLLKQMKLDPAAQCFARALQLKPDYPEACYYLGLTLAGQGKSAEAMPYFQQALHLATAQGNAALASAIRARLQAYQSAPRPR